MIDRNTPAYRHICTYCFDEGWEGHRRCYEEWVKYRETGKCNLPFAQPETQARIRALTGPPPEYVKRKLAKANADMARWKAHAKAHPMPPFCEPSPARKVIGGAVGYIVAGAFIALVCLAAIGSGMNNRDGDQFNDHVSRPLD
jgi:hypothetical protein